MNYIDKQFFTLIDSIQGKGVYELYTHMLLRFKRIAPITQQSTENFLNKYKFWGGFDSAQENYEVIYKRAQLLANRLGEFVILYKRLKDYYSKFVLYAILNNIYNQDFDSLQKAKEMVFKHYFDLNILPICSDKVFVDVGAYTGDTVLDFVASYGESYRKIYCYEMTKEMLPYIENNLGGLHDIAIKNCAVSDENERLTYTTNAFSCSANTISEHGEQEINAVRLDDDIKEKIDIIKMDIEGGEKRALIGAREHIKVDLPILYISVYHGNTDILDIPRLINSITKKYDFYLRYYGGCVFPTEIVLICMPKKFRKGKF